MPIVGSMRAGPKEWEGHKGVSIVKGRRFDNAAYPRDCLLLDEAAGLEGSKGLENEKVNYTIEVLKTDPHYAGQQKWMKLLKDGREITFNEVPEHHEKPINNLCQILYESKDKISELKIKIK